MCKKKHNKKQGLAGAIGAVLSYTEGCLRGLARLAVKWLPESAVLPSLRKLPKILSHEHLDCSVRPLTLLELWEQNGFQKAVTVPFQPELLRQWHAAGASMDKRELVAEKYQRYIAKFASSSLKNYVDCIVWTVLPVMQSTVNLYRITKERIEDAIDDGVIAMELRFAPQLHTAGGLTLDQVMEAVTLAVKESPIPVKLIICALRHETQDMARQLVQLAIRNKEHVSKFDLAGDEHANPGVLDWWLEEASVLKDHGIDLTVHLWETEADNRDDWHKLEKYGILVLGHAIRGHNHGNKIATVCPTSNVVTGQITRFADHPIEQMWRNGVRLTIDTDGTLFTATSATREYYLLKLHFGWGNAEFLACNLTALEQMPFEPATKQKLRAKLMRAYRSV